MRSVFESFKNESGKESWTSRVILIQMTEQIMSKVPEKQKMTKRFISNILGEPLENGRP